MTLLSSPNALRAESAGTAATLTGAAPSGPRWPWPASLVADATAYAVDATQRSILFWDTMRQAGNAFSAHERAGCPPVLMFDWDMVVDGRTLDRACNYALVRIRVPEGGRATDPAMRPFVIVDPRAGHGAGIGGFKSDSQVGIALRRGHPVYFVIFFREPEPGQTILDITEAERVFLRRVQELHPDAQKPVIIGNCQGGWAVMMLGATSPELTGPIVLNGAPLSYWAGERGRNPMRYLGGLAGGSWPAMLLADLGNGRFDGASLVFNFEALSPGNTWFRKYFNLYESVDTEAERFLEFDRWWGGYFLMNRDEMHWIVDNLFVGNRFARGEISAGGGASFDMRKVRSPIVVFASAGDNITPPGQALRWISDVYPHEGEIRARGQTILYLVHESIGHLGIFVSGSVALKEHNEIAGTLDAIEALPPGLYELQITAGDTAMPGSGFQVDLVERSIAHLRAISGEAENLAFPVVAQVSQVNQGMYDLLVSPVVRRFASEPRAEAARQLHPARMRRYAVSDANPWTWALAPWAAMVAAHRRPAAPDNPFRQWEHGVADAIEASLDLWRDWRDGALETAFHAVYGSMAAWGVAAGPDRMLDVVGPPLEAAPEVKAALDRVGEGGYAEAVIRIMVLLVQARGGVRRSRLEQADAYLKREAPFGTLTAAARAALIQEQTVIAALRPEAALSTLPALLPTAEDRDRALAAIETVAGPEAEMEDAVRGMLGRIRAALSRG